jgi:hypothetical protein
MTKIGALLAAIITTAALLPIDRAAVITGPLGMIPLDVFTHPLVVGALLVVVAGLGVAFLVFGTGRNGRPKRGINREGLLWVLRMAALAAVGVGLVMAYERLGAGGALIIAITTALTILSLATEMRTSWWRRKARAHLSTRFPRLWAVMERIGAAMPALSVPPWMRPLWWSHKARAWFATAKTAVVARLPGSSRGLAKVGE